MRLLSRSTAVFTALVAAHQASATTPSAKNCTDHYILKALAGTYSLVNTSSTLNGLPVPDIAYGSHPVGILTYSLSGWMSAVITATEPAFRPTDLTFPYQANDTDAEWAAVGKHSLSYAGPLSISNAIPATQMSGLVFHGPLVVADVPSWVGVRHVRNYTVVEGGEERYLRIESQRDGGNKGVLWWRRVD